MPAPVSSLDMDLAQAQQRWDAQFRRRYVQTLPVALMAACGTLAALVALGLHAFPDFELSVAGVALLLAWLGAGVLVSPLGLVFSQMPPRPTTKLLRKEHELNALYRALQERAQNG